MKFGKALRVAKMARSIPGSVKQKYEESPQKRGIETMVTKRGVDFAYKPLERAIDRTIAVNYTKDDAKTIRKWAKKLLRKGKGFTEQTKFELREKWPMITKNMHEHTIDQNDIEYLQKEVKPWIQYLKNQEIQSVLVARKIAGG